MEADYKPPVKISQLLFILTSFIINLAGMKAAESIIVPFLFATFIISITNFRCIRSDVNVSSDWEIFLDSYRAFIFYFNYYSRPATNTSPKNYRFKSSIKYEL
jgi:hypothetical protein